jgi:putative ABC transport system permease protein
METLRIAATALRANKLRSFLTLLGVIIGIMTIVSVVAVVSGLNDYITNKVFALNPDVFVITKFGIITSREEFLAAVRRKNIDASDVRAIENRCQRCGMIGSGIQSNQQVKRLAKRLDGVQLTGCTSNMAELNNLDLEVGRFFNPSEESHSAPLAIIGSDLKDELFGQLDPLGRDVTLGGKKLRVIGVLRKQGSVLGQNQDKVLYLPLSTFKKIFGSRRSVDIFIKPAQGLNEMQQTQDEVRTILRARRKTPFKAEDPFGMVTAQALQTLWKSISAGAFAFMIFISGISLIVGGIVITNIMLVSVIERTREIGLRRALGARRRDIMLQFLTEAMMLAGLGGLIGVGLGWAISKAIPMPTLVRPSLALTGLAVAILTGVMAGFFPARRAAKLAPIEALRFE